MSLSKETVEAASPVDKTTAPAAQNKPDLNKLRADAVSLDVPVRVHGSRVKEVVRGVTPHTEPFEEEASTMIVFPHGGVVRMATTVGVGQMLVLTNLRTSQDAICRVVKVRAYSNSQAYVEVEFTHRQVGYWGVHFPADDEGSFAAVAPAAPEPEKKPVVSSVTVKVEAMPKAPAPSARSESAFAPIGSQEDVQLAATHMEVRPQAIPTALPPRVSAPAPVASAALPRVPKMAPPPHSIEPVETASETPESNVEIEEEPRASRTFGTLTGGTGRTAQSAVSSDFGARLDTGVSAKEQVAAPRSNNWMWIAACLFFLVAGLAGGAFYFREHSTQPQGAAQAPVTLSQPFAPTAPTPATSSPPAQPVTQADDKIAATPAPPATIPEQSRAVSSAPEQQRRLAENPPTRELRPAATAPSPASKSFAPTDARPVARAIEASRIDAAPSVTTAPAVGVTPSGSEELPGVFNSSEAAPPPPPPSQQPLTRVRVGGVIVQPKLLHSVAPNYPSAARTAGISGSVVIVAHVDKTGEVTSMKVVSGPATLQSAAMSALRTWKYQPATLDGVPIATDVTVTIKFQQQ
jgi:periplasmic protein TonB